MATQTDLFLAVLALDAYNRGYNQGMTFVGDSDAPGSAIGDATIQFATDDQASRSANFYAVAYSWDGEAVISYRGTTFPSGPISRMFGMVGPSARDMRGPLKRN
jgi:hypothetical protein